MTVGSTHRLRVLPAPESRPPIVPPDEVYAVPGRPYVQDSLALDFLEDDPVVPLTTRRRDLPDPHPVVRRLAQAFLEVMAGMRPAPQVQRHAAPDVYEVLCRRSTLALHRARQARRNAVVRLVRVQEPADGVAEACVVVVHQDRVRAMAMRLTGLDGRWLVTDLQVG